MNSIAAHCEAYQTMTNQPCRAFAVKVVPKRLPVFPFSGLLKGCKGHKTHRFENGGTSSYKSNPENGKTARRFGTTFTANAPMADI